MPALIDTNIIIRYLIQDNEKQFLKTVDIFNDIDSGNLQVEILDGVIMESLYVLIKFYELPKNDVIDSLKTILYSAGVINNNKHILLEALNIFKNRNMDFVDCLICAKSKVEDYSVISFDKELNRCAE